MEPGVLDYYSMDDSIWMVTDMLLVYNGDGFSIKTESLNSQNTDFVLVFFFSLGWLLYLAHEITRKVIKVFVADAL